MWSGVVMWYRSRKNIQAVSRYIPSGPLTNKPYHQNTLSSRHLLIKKSSHQQTEQIRTTKQISTTVEKRKAEQMRRAGKRRTTEEKRTAEQIRTTEEEINRGEQNNKQEETSRKDLYIIRFIYLNYTLYMRICMYIYIWLLKSHVFYQSVSFFLFRLKHLNTKGLSGDKLELLRLNLWGKNNHHHHHDHHHHHPTSSSLSSSFIIQQQVKILYSTYCYVWLPEGLWNLFLSLTIPNQQELVSSPC